MDDDLKKGEEYRLIYLATFVVVFCIIPLVFILNNTDINRKQIEYNCVNPVEIAEILPAGETAAPDQFRYRLKDGGEYATTLKYRVGDKVCRY